MSEYRYTVLFEPAEEGGYVATCPALPGLVTEGDTLDEAREMVRDAICDYLKSVAKDGLPAPEDIKLTEEPVKEEVAVALPQAVNEPAPARSQTQGSYPYSSESGIFHRHISRSHHILKHPDKAAPACHRGHPP